MLTSPVFRLARSARRTGLSRRPGDPRASCTTLRDSPGSGRETRPTPRPPDTRLANTAPGTKTADSTRAAHEVAVWNARPPRAECAAEGTGREHVGTAARTCRLH